MQTEASKVGSPKEEEEQFGEDCVAETMNHITTEYLNKTLTGYAMFLPDYKEVNIIRTPFETKEGGLYVVAIMHITGPKINLDTIRRQIDEKAKAESQSDGTQTGDAASSGVVPPQEEVQSGPSTGESV